MANSARTLIDDLVSSYLRFPDRPFIINNGIPITYSQFASDVASVKSGLRTQGLRASEKVIVWGYSKHKFLANLYGVIAAGGTAVPVPHDVQVSTLNDIAQRCNSRFFLPAGGERFEGLDQIEPQLQIATHQDDTTLELEPESTAPSNAALIVFTSGTTARRKGVLLSHQNLNVATDNIVSVMELDSDIVEYMPVQVHLSFGFARVRVAARLGTTIVVDDGPFNLLKLLDAVKNPELNSLAAVPAMIGFVLENLQRFAGFIGKNIRFLEMGSSPLPAQTREKLVAAFPHAAIHYHYGLTEASRSTFVQIQPGEQSSDLVGGPSPGVSIDIAGPNGEPLPINEVGEIRIQGRHVALGYLGDESLTELRFTKDGFLTGDLGKLDENNRLHYVGRMDEIINFGGTKISPTELEASLRSVLPNDEYAVVGVPDPMGYRGFAPLLVLLSSLSEDQARAQLKTANGVLEKNMQLAGAVIVDEIPRTSNGKVQRRVLSDSIVPESIISAKKRRRKP